ncbi:hypothetical protein J2Y41_003469 [Arthrobacter sp. 1088]|uniref:hypothetical protein n=1 Tax=Arthrobacter sp. 1088 TaxID=2817768 RepID=UPI0028652FA2|nr:hypothetical protein [Arthrobacter sp. 1088]MDR6687893.1 hypothetical protein [Arthrobacter sp. 1088]
MLSGEGVDDDFGIAASSDGIPIYYAPEGLAMAFGVIMILKELLPWQNGLSWKSVQAR